MQLIDEAPELFGKTEKAVSTSRGESKVPAKVNEKTRKELLTDNEKKAKKIAAKAEADSLKEKQKKADEDARLAKEKETANQS